MNRLEDEKCVGCGFELLWPFNEMRLCQECLPKVLKVQYQTKMRNNKGKKPSQVLFANNFKLTNEPLGTKV